MSIGTFLAFLEFGAVARFGEASIGKFISQKKVSIEVSPSLNTRRFNGVDHVILVSN